MANPLKAGTVDDLGSSLARFMDDAMKTEWQIVRGEALPDDAGAKDRQILFAAIAQGLLRFLAQHKLDLVTTDEDGSGGGLGTHHHAMAFTVTGFRDPQP